MVSLNGFIKTHRKIMEWEWYKNQNVKDVFLHLCLNANFKENNFEGVRIKPGQLVTSQSHLAEELGLSRQKIRTALKNLERTGEITMEPTNKFTMITIVNWGKYQIQDLELTNNPTSEQPTVNQQQTSEQPQLNNDNNLIMEERKKDSQTAPSFSSSTPVPIPRSVEEVQQYCERMGYKIDAARFFYYYSGHGWKTGNEPIMDWHALVKYWNETQRESTEPVQEQTEENKNKESYESLKWYYDATEQYDKLAELEEKYKQEQDDWRVKAAR